MEDFCFPDDCILDPGRDLASLVGNADDAHPETSSSQILVASLRVRIKEKTPLAASNNNQEKKLSQTKDLGKEI